MINITQQKPIRSARLIAASVVALLAGCVQQYPISYYAGPGDTIVLGLGGIQRNTNGANTLTPSDMTVTLTNNSTNAVTTLSPGDGFKAFPDYSSGVNAQAIHGVLTGTVVPFDGGWFVPITLPNTSLPAGAYTISVTSPTNKLVNTKWCSPYWTTACEGDMTKIPLQIISNSNSSISGSYSSQFSYYRTIGGRLDVSPNTAPDSVGYPTVNGLQLVINLPAANYDTTLPIIALPYSHNPSISLSQNIVTNANGTRSLVVLLSAPKGFVTNGNRTPLKPVLSDLSLSFVFFSTSSTTPSPTQVLADFPIDQTKSFYYDASNNPIAHTQLQPAMSYQP